MSKHQVTLADIAKELGISAATVSRALKDYPDISQETKQKVLALAEKWKYRPNTIAAGLRNKETKIIGVIIPEIVNHFFSAIIKGIMGVAYKQDYRVMICQSDESYEKEKADAHALFDSRVDGIMVSLAHETKDIDHFLEFQRAGIPLVFFDKVPIELNHISKVVVDDYKGAYEVVKHLIDQGCRNIAHFRGPMIASTSYNRFQGYKDALKESGLRLNPDLIFDCEKIDMQEGENFARACINDHHVDAIFCITDQVAIGAIQAIKALGKSIPEDIAIAGFSNWSVSSVIEPTLTSVAQPGLKMGEIAMQLLLDQIRSQKKASEFMPPETIVLDTELVLRDSSLRKKIRV